MIYFERLRNLTCTGSQDVICTLLGVPDPTLKIWWSNRNVSATLNKNLTAKLKLHDIAMAEQFGMSGLDVKELMSGDVVPKPNTVFNISCEEYTELSRLERRYVDNNLNLYVCDLLEGGRFLPSDTVQKTISSCPLTGQNNIWLPSFIYYTLAEQLALDPVKQSRPKPEKLASLFFLKPRQHRLDLLMAIDDAGLLADSEWTLTTSKTGSISRDIFSECLSYSNKWDYVDFHPFIIKHQNELPRVAYEPQDAMSYYHYPQFLYGRYKWYVAAETEISEPFVHLTEKTFKGFMSGCPTLILGSSGVYNTLEDLGFRTISDFQGLSIQQRIDKIVDHIKNDDADYSDVVNHNQKLMLDVEHWEDYAVSFMLDLLKEVPPTRQ